MLAILQSESVEAATPKGFYDWWKEGGGYARKHLYNDAWLNKACLLLEYMEKHASNEAGTVKCNTLLAYVMHMRICNCMQGLAWWRSCRPAAAGVLVLLSIHSI